MPTYYEDLNVVSNNLRVVAGKAGVGVADVAAPLSVNLEVNSGAGDTASTMGITTPGAGDFVTIVSGRQSDQNPLLAWNRGALRVGTATSLDGQGFSEKLRITSAGMEVNGTVQANAFIGDGSNITNLDASKISTGTISDARIPATIARSNKFDPAGGHQHTGAAGEGPKISHGNLNDLSGADPGSSDTTKNKHVSNAQAKTWQDHVAITGGNPHGTTAANVGALSVAGGTLSGDLLVNGKIGLSATSTNAKLLVQNGRIGQVESATFGALWEKWCALGVPNIGAAPAGTNIYGLKVNWDSDAVVFGLKDMGGDRKDAIISWGDNSNDNLRFLRPNDVDAMIITGNGKVGINSTDPIGRLEINSPWDDWIFLKQKRSTGGGGGFHIHNPWKDTDAQDRNRLEIGYRTSAGEDKWGQLVIHGPTGNVGIGTVNPGPYKLYVNGLSYVHSIFSLSDKRFKAKIAAIPSALNLTLKLKGISFQWKKDKYKGRAFKKGKQYGLVAQEVEKILPNLVHEGPDGEKAVAYMEFIPLLIEAFKEQQKNVERLQKIVATLEKAVKMLKRKVK